MQNYDYQFFTPRRSARNLILFIAVSCIAAVGGLIILYFSNRTAGLVITILSLLALGTMVFKISAMDIKYGISINSLLLRKLFHKKNIDVRDISSVSLLDGNDMKRFMKYFYWPVVTAEREMNIAAWYRASKYFGMLTRFVSVPVVSSVTRAGGLSNILDYDTRDIGKSVLLKTGSEGYIIITPGDPEQFITRLRGLGVKEIRPSEFMEQDPSIHKSKGLRILSSPPRMKVYSLATFLLIAAGILVFQFMTVKKNQQAADQQVQTDNQVKEFSGEYVIYFDGRWDNDSLFYFLIRDTELEGTETEGEITVRIIRRYVIPAIWKSYLADKGLSPETVLNEEARSGLEIWLIGQPDYKRIGSFITEDDEKYWLYEQRTNGMKHVYFAIISNSYKK